jgi:hypothetical protein
VVRPRGLYHTPSPCSVWKHREPISRAFQEVPPSTPHCCSWLSGTSLLRCCDAATCPASAANKFVNVSELLGQCIGPQRRPGSARGMSRRTPHTAHCATTLSALVFLAACRVQSVYLRSGRATCCRSAPLRWCDVDNGAALSRRIKMKPQ